MRPPATIQSDTSIVPDTPSIEHKLDLAVCRLALNRNRTDWEFVEQPYATWAKEAARRSFTSGYCIDLVNYNDPNRPNPVKSKPAGPN